jgi:hypothetical protein
MCTVSFVPYHKGIIITSNRDEKIVREPASLPQQFKHGNHQLFFPVDGKANGTWFIVRDDASVGVLLNGAFEKHQPKTNYKASRGSILPTIFKEQNPVHALEQFDLNGIENFTLLIYHNEQLHEYKWNGKELFTVKLNEQLPQIYSSVTLYNVAMIQQREAWFDEWLLECPNPTQQQAIHFHSSAGKGNKDFGLQMNRNNHMQTVSITSVCIKQQAAILIYKDFIQQQSNEQTISINTKEMALPC